LECNLSQISVKFLAFFCFSVSTFSMSERPVWAVPESDVLAKYQTQVAPYFESGIPGTLPGKGQVDLAYRVFEVENEKGVIVLLPGRGEPNHKYAEFIYDLRTLGFSIYILDHRGQGESGFVQGVKIHYVQKFSDYVEDLDTFIRAVVKVKPHPKLFLIGHSMGGAIGTLYAAEYPGIFDGLILSAPMFDMNTKPYSKTIARYLGQFMCAVGFGKWSAARDMNQVTSSEARNEMSVQIADKYSKAEWRKISYRWILASLDALEAIQEKCQKLTLPTLLLQAEKDIHIPAEGQNRFSSKVSHCKKVVMRNSFHEILMETDSIRNLALDKIREFLISHSRSPEAN
jgi:lysophospholipase